MIHWYIKVTTYDVTIYIDFCILNVPEDSVEYEFFTTISIDSLLVNENKYYLQIYLNNCAYKIVNAQVTDCLDDMLFESD